ncbi:MAG TPA: AMP-binding protein, partial [Acetobacteraceae bacterium]|nr:AMP-binding protein [Acetobacteraceae bacterium]
MPDSALLPLTTRAGDEILFHRSAHPVSVREFLGDVAALAARLPAAGPAVNCCADRYHALVAFGAVLARGQTTLLSAERGAHRLAAFARDHGAGYVIAEEAPEGCPLPVVACGMTIGARHPAAPPPAARADHIAAIAFTSGSTGAPAPHPKPWGALVAGARAAAERFGLRHGDGPPASIVATVPAQHMYGFETTLMLPLLSAAAGHAGAAFYPSDVAEALHAVPPRRVLVTTPLHLRAQLAAGTSLPALEAVISATAPLDPALAAEAERAWSTRVLEIYGATEAGSVASRRTLDGPDWTPYPGVAFAIGEEAAEVTVPGLPAPVPLADVLARAEGTRFRLLGRRADLVKRAGKRASLAGLNRILAEIEGVQDGVFVAPEDLERNPQARLAAYVVAPGRTAEEILAALRARVEPAFLPRPVVMMEALPRDGLGKLARAALRP